jgi:hypothetical protein
MGFSKGSVAEATIDSGGFPLYTGIAPVTILAVNPTAEQLSAIYGRNVEKIASYTGTNNDGVDYVRLDFIVRVSDNLLTQEKIEGPIYGKVTFFLMKGNMQNKDGTKFKVINDYGQTSWVTPEVFKAGGHPLTNDGVEMKSFLLPYKACFNGEEELIKFLRAYLNIPNFMEMKDGVMQVVSQEKLEHCQSGFTPEEIALILKGNITPIREAISLQPNNQVKVLFAVRVTPDNKKYQHVFNKCFAKARDFGAAERFQKYLASNEQSFNGLEFNLTFGEWKETPTNLASESNSDIGNDNPWI